MTLWFEVTDKVRDAVHQKALEDGAESVSLPDVHTVLEGLYPDMPETERGYVAWTSLVYGESTRRWSMRFQRVNEEGGLLGVLSIAEVRSLIQSMTPGNPERVGRDVIIDWVLTP